MSGRGEAVIHTASAGGASQASTVQQLLAPVAAENQWQIATEDAAPLPDGTCRAPRSSSRAWA